MYGDPEEYEFDIERQNPEAVAGEFVPQKFTTKDSGKTAQYADGMQRDTAEGKPMFGLIFPKGVPYEEQLLVRVADLYARGAARYGDRNWEKSSTPESLGHHEEALWRHFVKFFLGLEDGEDHAAAVVWNVNAVLLTRRAIKLKTEKAARKKAKKRAQREASSQCEPTTQATERELLTFVFPMSNPDIPGAVWPHSIQAYSFPEAFEKFNQLMGRETAEHSAQLDQIQDTLDEIGFNPDAALAQLEAEREANRAGGGGEYAPEENFPPPSLNSLGYSREFPVAPAPEVKAAQDRLQEHMNPAPVYENPVAKMLRERRERRQAGGS